MIATVSTVKDTLSGVQRFVDGNLRGGVDHMVILLDGPDQEVEDFLAGHEQVTHVVADEAWWGRRPADLNDRQRIGANLVRSLLTVADGVDWLFHVDGDEICQIDPAAIAAVPSDCDAVRLRPLEAVSRRHWDESPTWFKRLLDEPDLRLLEVLGLLDKPANGQYFHGHVEGKTGLRPGLDRWLTIHRTVDEQRNEVQHHEGVGLTVLHYESYSGEDFVRKWSSMLSAGPQISLRPVRERTKQAVQALLARGLSREVSEKYLMRIFEQTTADDFDTLHELDLLVEVDPRAGQHQPDPLSADARSSLATLLDALAGVDKSAFDVCAPAAGVEAVLSGLGAGGPKRGWWRQNRRS